MYAPLSREKSSKNTIINLLIKNQEYLNKSVCSQKTVLYETLKTVQKGPLQQENNTETFRIICSNRFEVLATTDNDDNDNDSKSGKSEKIVSKEFLRNDDVKNRKKIQVSCITNR